MGFLSLSLRSSVAAAAVVITRSEKAGNRKNTAKDLICILSLGVFFRSDWSEYSILRSNNLFLQRTMRISSSDAVA